MFQNLGYSTVFLGLAAVGQQDLSSATLPARSPASAGELRRFADAIDERSPVLARSTEDGRSSEPLILAQATLPRGARASATKGGGKSTAPSGQWSLSTEVRGAVAQFVISNADLLSRWNMEDSVARRPTVAQKQEFLTGLRQALLIKDRPKIGLQFGMKDANLEIRLEEPLLKGARVTTISASLPQESALAAMQADPSKFDLTVQQAAAQPKVSARKPVEPPFLISKKAEKIDQLPKPLKNYCKNRSLEGVGILQAVDGSQTVPVFVGPKVTAEMLLDFGVTWTRDTEKATTLPALVLFSPNGNAFNLGLENEVKALILEGDGDRLKLELLYYFNSSPDGAKGVSISISPTRAREFGERRIPN